MGVKEVGSHQRIEQPYIHGLVAAYSLKFGYGVLVECHLSELRETRYWMTPAENITAEDEQELQSQLAILKVEAGFFEEHTILSPDQAMFVIRRHLSGRVEYFYCPKPEIEVASGSESV